MRGARARRIALPAKAWFIRVLLLNGEFGNNHFPAGTRRLCNVRLTLDMTSDRRWILVENENQVDVNIWRWLNVGFWLHNLKTTKSQRQLTSVLDINLTLTLDVGFTLDFGHPTSQPKFNQIPTSYDVVKTASITLKKTGVDPNDLNNYRPISNRPFI